MHRSEIHLHYAYIRARGKEFRILSTNYPKLNPGHWSSDFFGFFGMGTGEFWTTRPPEFEGVDCTVVPIEDTEMALLLWKDHPRFMGFIDCEGGPAVLLKGGDTLLYELPINWELYTQLGVPGLALDTMRTFRRGHVAYETPEENVNRVDDIIRMVQMF